MLKARKKVSFGKPQSFYTLALYVQSFSIYRKPKTNYRHIYIYLSEKKYDGLCIILTLFTLVHSQNAPSRIMVGDFKTRMEVNFDKPKFVHPCS